MPRKGFSRVFGENKEIGLIIVTIILFLILTIRSDGFLTYFNIANILRNVSLWLIIALAQALVMVIGGMNLSIGAIGALAATTVGYFMEILHMSSTVAILAAIIIGLLAGFFNGIVIVKTGLNAFIVTLATLFIFTGIVMGLTRGLPFTKIPVSFTLIGQGTLLMIPNLFLVTLVILIIIFILFRFSLIGRRILATGSNINASKFSGINTNMIVLFAHTVSGFIAALGGVLYVSRYGVAQPSIGNQFQNQKLKGCLIF
ncbi:MAG: ABC transporter permease [Actinobacteria bacterium]|nr:ABC transporter permease [Actinomycetota bacterium]